jgi:hypothetical protein
MLLLSTSHPHTSVSLIPLNPIPLKWAGPLQEVFPPNFVKINLCQNAFLSVFLRNVWHTVQKFYCYPYYWLYFCDITHRNHTMGPIWKKLGIVDQYCILLRHYHFGFVSFIVSILNMYVHIVSILSMYVHIVSILSMYVHIVSILSTYVHIVSILSTYVHMPFVYPGKFW